MSALDKMEVLEKLIRATLARWPEKEGFLASEVRSKAMTHADRAGWSPAQRALLTPQVVTAILKRLENTGIVVRMTVTVRENGHDVPKWHSDVARSLFPVPPPPSSERKPHPLAGLSTAQQYAIFDTMGRALEHAAEANMELVAAIQKQAKTFGELVDGVKRDLIAAGLGDRIP